MTVLNSSRFDHFADLREHLAPALYQQLQASGSLPPALIQSEVARLRAEVAAVATYIPSTLVREQLAAPAPGRVRGAYWNGSVLFADLSGFTALSGTLSALGKQGAEEVSAIINALFGALVDEIHRYRGGLLKFGGDAITAFFDAATLADDHARLACRAALAMQARMREFAALQTPAGAFQLRLRIGVHSGHVFAAEVGDAEHIELVVTGRNINRVALAQEIAEPGEVVISRQTYDVLPGARAEPRQSGFFQLQHLPYTDAPPTISRWGRGLGRGDMAELRTLARQVDALRPYLPRGLPRRFIAAGDENQVGEFRPVTVLFAHFYPFTSVLDMVGDDCDTAVAVLNAYYRRAQEVIQRYGGIVNKVDMYTYGDKLMALFGAPVANEDDPLRAARAALDLNEALAIANDEVYDILHPRVGRLLQVDRQFFKQRVGINTGVVFAGKVGSAQRHEYTVMGQHVNLAARLMSAAEERAIIVSPSTRRAIERHIELRELAPVRLKGIAEPVPIARAVRLFGVSQDPRRSVARPALVGRAAELDRIIAEARGALNHGSGRVVALAGEAGAGKTRLIEEALQQMVLRSGEPDGLVPFFPYSVEAQSYEQNTAYALARQLLVQFFNLQLADTPEQLFQLVSARVRDLAPELARFTPLLADLLGAEFADTPLTAALTPQQRYERASELFEALLLAEAHARPMVLIADDLHWADASSRELIARLAARAAQAPLLLLLGYRLDPPIAEPWRQQAACARLELRDLPPESSAALVRELLRGEPPAELTALIERTQGNPFFIEEVVRGMVESGALVRAEASWRLTRPLDEISVPDSIEGVITARLDRLDDRNRDVLQISAVIGRRFLFPILSGVINRPAGLPASLQTLTEADLIATEDQERDLAYLFRHALTRDVAYEAILYARRRDLHRRVAQRIEALNHGRLDDQLALLARHYLLAEEWATAFDYHLRAGRQAQARYANREAIALFERALQIAEKQEPRAESQEPRAEAGGSRFSVLGSQVIELLERLGVVHALIGEYDQALERYGAALDLLHAQPGAAVDGVVRLHHHIARVHGLRANFETALEWVERALKLPGAEQCLELARCLNLGIGLHQRQGRFSLAQEWGERALQLATQHHSRRDQAYALRKLGGIQINLGNNAQALSLLQQALTLNQHEQNLGDLADTHNDMAIAYFELGRLAEAHSHYEAGAAIKQSIGDIYGEAMIANNLGNLLKLQNNVDAAIRQYQHSLAIFERLGSVYATGLLHMNIGATHLQRGDLAGAEASLRRSATLFNQAGAEDFLPELERCMAELHLQRGDMPRARLAAELSLETAQRLEARAEEGMTRRVLALILARSADYAEAWSELQQSLALLREAAGRHEIARTLVALAALAPALGHRDLGGRALAEAIAALREAGARRDLDEALAVARRYHYEEAL
ncbi:adenylate/guanylate cyclase domain-containing protein [Kouleothrix sp.]|uniref:adenylate/guanylate cyclase domain-containing protein n=1 Tax=Kouleothrix sp. TaxID=2779161 RepID=UPI00391AF1A3